MSNRLAPRYDHTEFENRIYQLWNEGGYFSPQGARAAQLQQWSPEAQAAMPDAPFVIAIPPPNVTGILHMGHGLNISVQDICIRHRRMCGYETLWIPGCDHAGIATQHVVERMLAEGGQSREQLGRERFIREAERISQAHHDKITEQIKRMGASCDWQREAFTLDEERSKAVREVFVRLYEKEYLYRGEYLVNWCAQCSTALSDDEVDHLPEQGGLYRIRYPLSDSRDEGLEIVTTRPETMLGDEAVAVHPEDPRYRAYIGKRVLLPLVNRELPVIGDSYIDREFGSGVLKVTPAHDMNDFEIAKRHDLPITSIFTKDGRLNDRVPAQFRGLSIADARQAVINALEEGGYLLEHEAYNHQVGHCYRCGHIIEPHLSTQWFVKMKPLAKEALDAWKRGEVRFVPARWEATYRHWLENIRDWCISRQLWWGHRIPAWYDQTTGEMIVSRSDPERERGYAGRNLLQDDDVLDTWFSSWLWPFTILGWPATEEADFTRYYPTSTLITGYDIIFFWVARMIMAGREFTARTPFRDVVLTGLIRDKKGKKMSKSLGNGIDPLEIIDSYGADALKFSLTYLMAHGQDIRLAKQDFAVGSRFANKIWNGTRFILSHSEARNIIASTDLTYSSADHWIHAALQRTITEIETYMTDYRLSDATHSVYNFFWYDFCDWYLESAKLELGDNLAPTREEHKEHEKHEKRQNSVYSHLLYILETTLRLLHPFMSFLTEELYQHIRPLFGTQARYTEAIIIAPYPTAAEMKRRYPNAASASAAGKTATLQFTKLQAVVTAMRTIRSEFSIAPEVICQATIIPFEQQFHDYLTEQTPLINHLAQMQTTVAPPKDASETSSPTGVAMVLPTCEVVTHILDQVDAKAQMSKLQKQYGDAQKRLQRLEKQLAPDSPFCLHAKPEVVDKEKERLRDLRITCETLKRFIHDLQ